MSARIKITPDHICSLRPLWTLDNFEFDRVPFVEGFVSLAYDCRVMDKYIWTVLASNEAVAFRVIEPFDLALHYRSFRLFSKNSFTAWRTRADTGASDFFDIWDRAFVCGTVSHTTVLLMPYGVLQFIL